MLDPNRGRPIPSVALLLLACRPVPESPPVREPTPIQPVGGDGRIEASVEVRDLMQPALVPAAPAPVDNPVQQTPRRVYRLDGATLTRLGGPRGRQLLLEQGDATYHLEAWLPLEVTAAGEVEVGGAPCALDAAATAELAPYAEVCPGLWRRNPVKGRRSALEWGADFVRDRFARGEKLTELVKTKLMKDKGREVAGHAAHGADVAGSPPPVEVTEATGLVPDELGLPLEGAPRALNAGEFYAIDGVPGIWLAAVSPGLTPAVPGLPVDPEELDADVLLVAYDLTRYTMDFALGTDHPRLGWADRVRADQRTDRPGPDGFDGDGPLVRTGAVPPERAQLVVSTFTGGFKRSHGAFHRGALATVHHGSHYGFVEEGIVWSRPQPGIATVTIDWDGDIELFAWTEADDARLAGFRHVRQNGAPILMDGKVGDLVTKLAEGNWSGSVEGNSRSMRAGLCIRPTERGRQLLYGYFTAATPSGMARVFTAAGCESAMLTDMNALEHTYLAVYTHPEGGVKTHNLDTGMAVLDVWKRDKTVLPRFLAVPDNRDFFAVRERP